MAPIRVGILGLSRTGWAQHAHLPCLSNSPEYEIVALCNTKIDTAIAARDLYRLPRTVRTYGDPEDLAEDPEVDLVVCSVRVDKHFATVAPALKAGKNVLVEWPLGKNLAEAEELLRLKNEGGVKVASVGLQGRQAPWIKRTRELVEEGKIGRVLSSTWTGVVVQPSESVHDVREYFTKREVGGNIFTIHFGHAIDCIQQVLGYFNQAPNALIANRSPIVKLLSAKDNSVIDNQHPNTSEDVFFLNGTLGSDIPLSFSLRTGPAFPSTAGLDWRISGSTGEIRITSPFPYLQIGYDGQKVELFDFESGLVEEIKIEDEFEGNKSYAAKDSRNVARMYRELAAGKVNCSFEDAVERHRLIAEIGKLSRISE